MDSDPRFAAICRGVGGGKWRMMQNGDPDLLSALRTLCDDVCWVAPSYGDQSVLGQRGLGGDIRNAASRADRAPKGLSGFFYHVASLSVFSFLRARS